MFTKPQYRTLLLSTLVFLGVQLIYMLLPPLAGMSYFDPMTWKHFDAGHYLTIATEGYSYMPCPPEDELPPGSMCGTAGWFPGFPLLIRAMSWLFGNPLLCGWLIALTFFCLSLYKVARLYRLEKVDVGNVINLSLAAFFLGSIYYMAVFPVSAVIFFCLWAFELQLRGKFKQATIPVFLCTIFYPTGFLLAGVLAVHALIQNWNRQRSNALLAVCWVLSAGILGVVLVFFMFYMVTGDWQAFIRVQAKYGHGLHFPIRRMYEMYLPLAQGISIRNMDILQSTLVILGYFWISWRFFKQKLYRQELLLLAYLFVSAYFWFPWTVGGNLSRYRAEALLLPAVFFFYNTPMRSKVALLSVFLAVGSVMSYLFFIEVLI